MVFITAGMGGGTGTGSAAMVAELAKEPGALTIGVVTQAVRAGRARCVTQRRRRASTCSASQVDALIVIPNDRLAQVAAQDHPRGGVPDRGRRPSPGRPGHRRPVVNPGVINLDFADVKAIMENAGEALMGIGHGAGDTRAEDAAKQAVSSPLLETSIDGATRHPLQHHRRQGHHAFRRCQKAAEIVTRGGRPGREHHLRGRARRDDAGRDQDHGHRHRLRRQDAARGEAGDDASYDRSARVRRRRGSATSTSRRSSATGCSSKD